MMMRKLGEVTGDKEKAVVCGSNAGVPTVGGYFILLR